ncbi:MAG: hypothetical protein IT435_03340 [Phycisphaerales bacterium]|nr:hypothetical protein [Phycisphaerales bacterium]
MRTVHHRGDLERFAASGSSGVRWVKRLGSAAGLAGGIGLVSLIGGCASESTGPVYEERNVRPATLDETRGGSSMRVWK